MVRGVAIFAKECFGIHASQSAKITRHDFTVSITLIPVKLSRMFF